VSAASGPAGGSLRASRRNPFAIANVRWFIAFRLCFNSRFYYPVFSILFLDYGLTLEQFALLNAVWAATIVGLEVPTGALADVIGRRRLVVSAAGLMLLEMLLLCFAPRGDARLLFAVFLLNRILSGAAEAAASGADEAIAYDSLKRVGLEDTWPQVLHRQMRWQSLAYMGAMVVGSAVYDAGFLGTLMAGIGVDWRPDRDLTLRLPPLLTLLSAVGALISAGGLREEEPRRPSAGPGRLPAAALEATLAAGRWILKTPAALMLILIGMCFDSALRMLVTLISQYYRLIQLPEALFGLIGSAIALLGFFTPSAALWMSRRCGIWPNFAVMAALAWAGLFGLGMFIPVYGLVPAVLIFGVLTLNHFFMSHYLNRITTGEHRATVLSLKGLGFNLAYGLVGLIYSFAVAMLRRGADGGIRPEVLEHAAQDAVFVQSVAGFPWVFLAAVGVMLALGRRWLRG
jgi:MFS family permease